MLVIGRPARNERADGGAAADRRYLSSRDIRRSAKTLPPVWQSGQ